MRRILRGLAWRVGRKLYTWARHDHANDPTHNGEHWLIERVVERANAPRVLLDVGANLGNWSHHAVQASAASQRSVSVHAFEPCTATRDMLTARLSSNPSVQIHALALSSSDGEADFYFSRAGAGTSSLSSVSGATHERVKLQTLDGFIDQHALTHVALLKIDTEGFDFGVMQGAERALTEGRVDVVQFEYNWRWLINRASLRDVFGLIAGKPYRFGKLAGDGIVFFDAWHFELDRFFENNYVLIRVGSGFEDLGRTWRFDRSNVAVTAGD